MTIHTFKLSRAVTCLEYHHLQDYFYKTAHGIKGCCYEKNGILYYNLWQPSGILLTLMETRYGWRLLHFRINPSRMTSCTTIYDPITLFTPDAESVALLSSIISAKCAELPLEKIEGCSDTQILKLNRVDLCMDVPMGQNELDEYNRLLSKGYSSSGWTRPSLFGDDRDLHSFRAANSRFQVTVYDKLYEIANRHKDIVQTEITDNRIMRIEVSLSKKGINSCRDKAEYDITLSDEWPSQLLSFSEHGTEIMVDTLKRIFGPNPYLSLRAAADIIYKELNGYTNKKDALLSFLKMINHGKRVDVSVLRYTTNGKNRLSQLEKLGINPVTIEARSGISFLPSLCQLVRDDTDPSFLLHLAVGSDQITSEE